MTVEVAYIPRTDNVLLPTTGGLGMSEPFNVQFVEVEFINPSYEYEQLVAIPHETYGDQDVSSLF